MYTITLYTLGLASIQDETHEFNIQEFVARCGAERAEWNLNHLWAAVQPLDADGPAVQVNFITLH
jgi:hypothetical protein